MTALRQLCPSVSRLYACLLLSIGFIGLLGGCKSYQLGNPAELTFQSIYVKPVQNDSYAPQAQALLSSQIRDAFIRDGRLALATSEEAADVVLLVNLTDYRRRAASRSRQDTRLGTDFDLTLEAELALFDQNKGSYLFQRRKLSERSNAYAQNPYAAPGAPASQGFIQSEYQAMPRLTRGLAQKIADEVLSPWTPR
ncbi:MAG: hypothetical protein EA353_02550 [Puniceicoccaceae bacterium]|nr:MAG: hypothetical protein EA353_02550 [Puniceicoccaceae bacterium]